MQPEPMRSNELIQQIENALVYPSYSKTDISLPGEIKTNTDDFIVSEIPLYQPSGEGDHLYLQIEKRGLTTRAAIGKIAGALNIPANSVGVAGLKDARGVTTQLISIEHISESKAEALDIPGIRILKVSRHRNKLKMGHLLGNQFVVKLRKTNIDRIEDVRKHLAWLETHGMPNYFGMQRFGSRGDNWLAGKAILKGDYKQALEIILGTPTPSLEGEAVTRARRFFDEEAYDEAAGAWPRGFGENARLCRMFVKTGGHFKKTVQALGKSGLTFYISAYQSFLFNEVVANRIQAQTMETMLPGDVAWKHDKGVCFSVTDSDVETERAGIGEISPTGPLYGKKMKWPEGASGEFERSLLEREGVTTADFSKQGPFRSPGGRRPLRVFPSHCQVTSGSDSSGDFLQFRFSLPSGSYATVLMSELCRSGMG